MVSSLWPVANNGGPASLGPVPGWFWITVLVLDVIVVLFVWKGHKRFTVKVVWTALVVLVPIGGLVAYVLLGRERR